MKSFLHSLVATGLFTAAAATLPAATIYADALVSSQFVTAFGSGSVVGAPDGGGVFLGDTFDPPAHQGNIVVHFATPLTDGPGADIQVIDITNNASETVNIQVSNDGVNFTSVGGLNSVANSLDIAGAFSGSFSYIKITNTSAISSMDVDAVIGLNAGTAVPEPATYATFALALAGLGWARRR